MTTENIKHIFEALPTWTQEAALRLLMTERCIQLEELELEQQEMEDLLNMKKSYNILAFEMSLQKQLESDEEEPFFIVSHHHHTRTRAERRASKRKHAGRDRSHGKRSHWGYKMYSSGRNNDCSFSAKERRMQSYANNLLDDPDPVEQGLWVPFDKASKKQEGLLWDDYAVAMASEEIQRLQGEVSELLSEMKRYERIRQNAQQNLDEAGVLAIDADFIYMK